VERIREGVRRFRREIFPQKRELYERLAEKQTPQALFLTCGDSRIASSLLTGTEPGQIFVERTPGNIVPVYNADDRVGVSASIEYSVAVLGVRDIIVCGHSACGAMKALLNPHLLADIPATARWLTFAAPAVARLDTTHSGLDEERRVETLTKLNVIEQIAHLHTHPVVEARLKAGVLGLHGWFYEIHTGRVDAYDPDTGAFAPWPDPL
jgi:carbonic anhydrase